MYRVREFAELTMTPLSEWTDEELRHYHLAMSDLAAYLNTEGVSLHTRMIHELESRQTHPQAGDGWPDDTYPFIE